MNRHRGGPLWFAIDLDEHGAYRALRAAGQTRLPPVKEFVDLGLLDAADAYGSAE